MLRTFPMKNTEKGSKHPKVSCRDDWVRLFPNLRLLFLFSKVQYIKSKIRIVLTKLRSKMRILNSLIVPKNVKLTLRAFLSSSWAQKIKKTKERTLWRHRKISGKNSQCRKRNSKIQLSELSSNEKSSKNYGTQR